MTDPPAPRAAESGPSCTLQIDRITWSGAGRAVDDDGRYVDVVGAYPGERVQARLDPHRSRRAHLLRIEKPAPARIDPACDQMQACPGCPLRGLPGARRQALTDPMHRAAVPTGAEVAWSRLPGAADDGGRARAVARALWSPDGRLVLGMVRAGQPPIELGRCPLQSGPSRALVARLQAELRAVGVEPWDAEARRGTLRHVIVQTIGDASRVIFAVDGAGPPIPFGALLTDRSAVSLLVDALPRRGAGLTRRPRLVRGEAALWFTLDGDRFRASPRSWIPQAPATVPGLRRAVLRLLAPRPTWRVVEIGCGIGTLSLPIARRVEHLTGLDIERDAALDAEVNAAANGVENADFRTGEAGHGLRRLLGAGRPFDGVVMHAMRRPFGAAAMSAVRALRPERVVCISPFAPALARDLDLLGDYVIEAVELCDQTPGAVPDLTLVALSARG